MKHYLKKTFLMINILALSVVIAIGAATAVDDGERHSDTWLEAKLDTLYLTNRHLSLFDIDTDVKNQVAYLTGVVQSSVEKDLAGEIAKSVEGITSVDNKIVVDANVKQSAKTGTLGTDRSVAQKIDDMTTTASIKSQFLTNNNVGGLSINVDTTSGIVTLSGAVKSDAERALAVKLAENTDGVKQVVDKLVIDLKQAS